LTVVTLKLLLAPSFVVAASLVSRRYGVRVGGIFGGLPAIAGPILLVLAIDEGTDFAAGAAAGVVLGVVAVVAFVVAYVLVAPRLAWPWAVAAGWAAFFIAVLALKPIHVSPFAALLLAWVACAVTLLLVRRPPRNPVRPPAPPPWDLPLRAACAVVPVVAVTALAHTLGPHVTGLVAAFPIITPVLAAFTQAQQGPQEAVRLLRGMTSGFFAYALFGYVIAITVEELGIGASFALATALALAVQGIVLVVTQRREQSLAAEATV
jgi:hypothetical protein